MGQDESVLILDLASIVSAMKAKHFTFLKHHVRQQAQLKLWLHACSTDYVHVQKLRPQKQHT